MIFFQRLILILNSKYKYAIYHINKNYVSFNSNKNNNNKINKLTKNDFTIIMLGVLIIGKR